MKLKILGTSFSAAVVMLLMTVMSIASAGGRSAPSMNDSAAVPANCSAPPGVVVQAPYSSAYTACSLGMFPVLPGGIGGIAFKRGDPNTLLVATYASTYAGVLYSVPVLRDSTNHIIGFPYPGAPFANASYNSTGLAYGPGDVLFYSRWPVNELGEFKPGSVQPDRVIDLAALGVSSAVSGISFVPPGFPRAGELKLVTRQNSDWYAATVSPQADGTYGIATLTKKSKITGYPEGFVYAPARSPQFVDYSAMLVGEYYDGTVSAYALDSESNPVPSTRKSFLTGLPWVQGLAIDPLTGDMIVTNYSARVISVRGFGTLPVTATNTPTATATAGPSPKPTYSITGRVADSRGAPITGVDISAGGKTTVTNDAGYYFVGGFDAGYYSVRASRSGYFFQPDGAVVNVSVNGTQNFTGTPSHSKRYPPVIIVHGFLGIGENVDDKCEYGVDYWEQPRFRWFDDLPKWLANDGFDVWISHWTSAPWPGYTAPIEANGLCLADQIAEVKRITGQSKVILLAHSMGGLVARAYLQSNIYATRKDVQALVTLGTPHAGIKGLSLVSPILWGLPLGIFCLWQPAFCEAEVDYMSKFNARSETNTIPYYLIGADGGGGPVGSILYLSDGPIDGLVGVASATGRNFGWLWQTDALRHPSVRYKTHESHLDPWGISYFEPRSGQAWSDAYKCVRQILLGLNTTDCSPAPKTFTRAAQNTTLSAITPLQTGHITTGATLNRTVPIDAAGESYFALTWLTGTLSLNLVDPNGVTIDPVYAMNNPSAVSFDSGPAGNGSPGWMTYSFTNTVPGTWRFDISAPDAGPGGTGWTALAGFASTRTLEVGTGAGPYRIGDTATFTATLKSGVTGISGATVRLDLARSDNVTDTLTLADVGGGNYRGTYKIPNAPGYVDAIFTANGSDGNTAFTRQSRNLISVMPQTGQLTSRYADRTVDENGDNKPEALAVDIGVNISKAGDYNLSADLRVGDQVVAQSSKLISATAGSQTFTLRFEGSDLYTAKLDGPYTLTNLVLVDLQAAVPTAMGSNLYTTAPYRSAQFGPGNTLYLPLIVR